MGTVEQNMCGEMQDAKFGQFVVRNHRVGSVKVHRHKALAFGGHGNNRLSFTTAERKPSKIGEPRLFSRSFESRWVRGLSGCRSRFTPGIPAGRSGELNSRVRTLKYWIRQHRHHFF